MHVGALGGAWQALVRGFLGARVDDGVLALDPHLPAAWPSLEVRMSCLRRDVRVVVRDDEVLVDASRRLRVRVGPVVATAGGPSGSVRFDRGRA